MLIVIFIKNRKYRIKLNCIDIDIRPRNFYTSPDRLVLFGRCLPKWVLFQADFIILAGYGMDKGKIMIIVRDPVDAYFLYADDICFFKVLLLLFYHSIINLNPHPK